MNVRWITPCIRLQFVLAADAGAKTHEFVQLATNPSIFSLSFTLEAPQKTIWHGDGCAMSTDLWVYDYFLLAYRDGKKTTLKQQE
jgi:hypothetical protein